MRPRELEALSGVGFNFWAELAAGVVTDRVAVAVHGGHLTPGLRQGT